jgi:hypothetical protein
MDGQAWCGELWLARLGKARLGWVSSGEVGQGEAWLVRQLPQIKGGIYNGLSMAIHNGSISRNGW